MGAKAPFSIKIDIAQKEIDFAWWVFEKTSIFAKLCSIFSRNTSI